MRVACAVSEISTHYEMNSSKRRNKGFSSCMKIYFFLCKIRFSDLILHLVIPVLLQFIFMSERMVLDVVRGGQFIIVGRAPPFFFFDTGILKSSTPSTILVVMIMIVITMGRIIDHDHHVLIIMRMKIMTVNVSVKLWGGLNLKKTKYEQI